MGNCLIAYPNRIDEATLAGGSWLAGLPRANLQDRSLYLVARSSDATLTSTQFNATFPTTRAFRVFALANHNLSESALVRFRLYSTSGGTLMYDSTWVSAWQITYDPNLIPWGDAGLWRGIDGDEFIGFDRPVVHVADGFYDGTYLLVEIDDTTNAAGYVQVGRPFVGAGVTPTTNASRDGWGESWEDTTVVQSAVYGAEFFDERAPYRVQRLKLERISAVEFQRIYEAQRLLGVSGEVFWVPDVDSQEEAQRRGFLGRMRTLTPIEWPYVSEHSAAFELKELQP